MNNPFSHYFERARDWQGDRLHRAEVAAQRWFIAFLVAALTVLSITIALIILLPLKTLVPLVVQHNPKTGEIWVHQPATPYAAENSAQTEADLVRYVVTRESYSAVDLNQRFHLVMLQSNANVADQYANAQANSNPHAPIQQFGINGARTVQIEDIVFLNKSDSVITNRFHQPASNLAKVDFSMTSTPTTGQSSTTYWVATIAWIYRGLPDNPQEAWDNWNGFTVTTYRLDPRVVSHTA
jgi:type IV secretion system protein VirB8